MKIGIAILSLFAAVHSHAAVVAGINFGNSTNANNLINLRAAGDRTAGTGIYATDTWTDIDVTSIGPFTWGPLAVTSSAGGSAAQITSNHTTGFNGFSGSVGAMADSADRTLMNGYSSFNASDAGTITLSSISTNFTSAPGGYSLVIYFETDNNNRTGTFTVDGTSISGLDGSTFSGTYVQATGSNDSNYALFTGLTASSIDVDVDSDIGRMGIAGMTLYAVPEPSAATLGLAGLSVCLLRRRR